MIDTKFVFEILHMHQVGVSIFCCLIVCAADTLLFSSLVFLKYYIQILGHRLSQCGVRNFTDRSHNEELIDCIKIHVDIKKSVETILTTS